MPFVNIGVIGLGFMGATHSATYARLPDVRIAAVSARNDRLLAGDFSGVGGNLGRPLPNVDLSNAAKYHDWRQLLLDPDVQCVDICLPTDLHEAVTVAALAAGKHVFCEKPMALDAAQCERMLNAARHAGRVLMIGHVLRFWPAYEYLREFVSSQPYGPIRSATFTRYCGVPDWSSWLPEVAKSGGAILDLLIHDLDQILLLFGPPASLRAKALGNVDAVTASLLYPDGPEVRLQGGWLEKGTPFSMGFQVRADRAEIALRANILTLADDRGSKQEIALPEQDPFAAEFTYFRECCELDRIPQRCPPDQSAAAVKLASLVRKARTLEDEVKCDL